MTITLEDLIPWLILLGVCLVSTGILSILKAMKKINPEPFFFFFLIVNILYLFLLILVKIFDND